MPNSIIINNEEYFFVDYKETFLMKRSVGKPLNQELVYESEIGAFKDILFSNDVLTARTSEGWFFSKDIGRTWMTESQWETENEMSLKKIDYQFVRTYLKSAMDKYCTAEDGISFTIEERVKCTKNKCLELMSLENSTALDRFLQECLKAAISDNTETVFVFQKSKNTQIEDELFNILVGNKRFVRKRELSKAHQPIYLFPVNEFDNLYSFYYAMVRFKTLFDIKKIIIPDMMLFFTSYDTTDVVESTINLLCEIADSFDVKVVAAYSKTASSKTETMEFITTYNHKLLDRFQQENLDGELKLREVFK